MLRKKLIACSSTQRMIKADNTLYFRISIGNHCQTRRQERLLRCQHFQVIGRAMFHQQTGIVNGNRQMFNLLFIKHNLLPGVLPLVQSIVHFSARIEKRLLELQQCFFPLCFRYFQISNVFTPVEDRLYKRTDSLKQPVTGIGNNSSGTVCPAG